MSAFICTPVIGLTKFRPQPPAPFTSRPVISSPLRLQRSTLSPWTRIQPTARMVRVSVPLLVEAPQDLCYRLFSDLSLMPEWSSTLKSVQRDPNDPKYSDWTFAWNGIRLSWRAVDTEPEEDDGEHSPIRWRSVSGLDHIGCVDFKPIGSDQTELTMTVDYDIASLLAVIMESSLVSTFVQGAIETDLQRFRSYALRCLRKERIEQRKTVS